MTNGWQRFHSMRLAVATAHVGLVYVGLVYVGLVVACAVDDRDLGVAPDDQDETASNPFSPVGTPSGGASSSEPASADSDRTSAPTSEGEGQAPDVTESAGGAPPLDPDPAAGPSDGSDSSAGASASAQEGPSVPPVETTPPPEVTAPPPPPPDQDITVGLTGAGRVISSPGGIDCPGVCTARFAGGSTVTLTASGAPESDSYFAGWTGDCAGFDECALTIDRPHAVAGSFGAANTAFVTSRLMSPGEFVGLEGADQVCRSSAAAAGLSGTFMAWLSSSSADAIDRLGGARGWVRRDGLPIGNSPAEMLSGQMFYPARLDEMGGDVGDRFTWTGTDFRGRWSQNSCGDWIDVTAQATLGGAAFVGTFFTDGVTSGCDTQPASLLCLGTDRSVRVEPPRSSGRLAFVSDGLFASGAGIAAADALCQTEALAVGRSGTFRAALALADTLPEQRFDLTGGPWVRVDGVLLADTARGFFLDDLTNSALNVTASGKYYSTSFVWYGQNRLGQVNTDTTCANWTSTTATTGITFAVTGTIPGNVVTVGSSCSQQSPIICLEN